jgi:hypothetical protein
MKTLFVVFFSVVLLSCKTTKPIAEDAIILSYETGPCRGKCPEYKIEVISNKKLTLVGIKNIEQIGEFSASLSDEQLKTLQTLIENCKKEELKEKYTSKITDLSTRIIKFGDKKVVMYGKDIPDSLLKLENEVKSLVKKTDWNKN